MESRARRARSAASARVATIIPGQGRRHRVENIDRRRSTRTRGARCEGTARRRLEPRELTGDVAPVDAHADLQARSGWCLSGSMSSSSGRSGCVVKRAGPRHLMHRRAIAPSIHRCARLRRIFPHTSHSDPHDGRGPPARPRWKMSISVDMFIESVRPSAHECAVKRSILLHSVGLLT